MEKRRIITMSTKQHAMKPVQLSEVEVLKLYGDTKSNSALALKVGKAEIPPLRLDDARRD